ncbi:MAG: hypothetical protein JSS68_09715 [Actinobacteria bacterium]|nr:hypothetical protein [Actinomycetota bacterium]
MPPARCKDVSRDGDHRKRDDRPHLSLVPVSLKVANAYVREHHRHNRPVLAAISVVGVEVDGRLCGVAIIGRPVARMLEDGYTAEVRRVCTDGTYNACSMLLRAAWRAVKALGYRKLITYTLPEEGGASLRAAGFKLAKTDAGGGRWSRQGRPAPDDHPLGKKYRWELPN